MFIFIIDNNLFYISVLKEMLKMAGFSRIGYANDGYMPFSDMLPVEIPDVLIIDEKQCFSNGVDTIRNLRSSKPELTAIILTSAESNLHSIQKPVKGGTHFIRKESISDENLTLLLYSVFTEKVISAKKGAISRIFPIFRKPHSNPVNQVV